MKDEIGDALLSRITIDPAVCHGKPVIRGKRYPVESMLEYLAGGDTVEIESAFLDSSLIEVSREGMTIVA